MPQGEDSSLEGVVLSLCVERIRPAFASMLLTQIHRSIEAGETSRRQPLVPLLSNTLLNEFARDLERRRVDLSAKQMTRPYSA